MLTPSQQNLSLRSLFARNLRAARQAQGLSQEALAELAQLHRTYVSSVERCERNITLDTVERLANALGISALDLLREK
jgi:transcriptional regulator with XRE-family HTH domain